MESNITLEGLDAHVNSMAEVTQANDIYAVLQANAQARADAWPADKASLSAKTFMAKEAERLKIAFEAFDEMRERTLKSANESLDWAIDNIKSGTYARRHILDIIDHASGAIEECESDPDNCDIHCALNYAARAALLRECLEKRVINLPHNERFW